MKYKPEKSTNPIVQESLAFIAEAFGRDSVELEGSCSLPSGLPLQTLASVEAYACRFLGSQATLIVVKGSPSTQQVLALVDQLKSLPAPRVFSFKEIEKELAGLLVAHDVPHLVPGRKLFIPQFGLLYKDAPDRRERWRAQRAARLSATGRQVITCALLRRNIDWQQDWKPMELRVVLHGLLPEVGLSPATHTRLLAELVDLGFGESMGGGPHKRFAFVDRVELWRRLLQTQTDTVLRRVRLSQLPANPVYAGAQAFSRLSRLRLSPDEPIELAMSQRQFEALSSAAVPSSSAHILVQIWRNTPALPVLTNGELCLNVIDLALTTRHSADPREIEILHELLLAENLSPTPLTETL